MSYIFFLPESNKSHRRPRSNLILYYLAHYHVIFVYRFQGSTLDNICVQAEFIFVHTVCTYLSKKIYFYLPLSVVALFCALCSMQRAKKKILK